MMIRDRLERVGARFLPGAGGFFSWWGESLASWLPVRWRALLGLSHDRLLLVRQGESLQLRLASAAGLRDLGTVPWAADDAFARDPLKSLLNPRTAELPRWLLLPAAAGLRRRLQLPAAASERLRDVLGFEIDRQTPFSAESAVFDAHVLGRHGDGQLDVELVVVPRASLDAALAALGPLSGTLSGVDLADAAGVPLGVNLLPEAQRRRQVDPWRGRNWALAGIAVLAIALAMWQMLANRRAAADAFEREIAAHSADARRIAVDRQRLVDLVEGSDFLDRSRAARPTMVELMDELSRRIPDSTYLEKLSIEGDRMLLIGLSSEASSLVGRLEGSKLWHSPALTGALQPDPRTRRDRFTLIADLPPQADDRPRGAAAAPRANATTDADDGPTTR